MSRAVPVFVREQEREAAATAQDHNFAAMSGDALRHLHEELRIVLAAKMAAQRQELDERLRDLEQFAITGNYLRQPGF